MAGEEIARTIIQGGVGILPTDTIYGIVGKAVDFEAYERILALKKRSSTEKFVILTASWEQVQNLGITLSAEQRLRLNDMWPGPTTAVLDAPGAPAHLQADDRTIAVRWPKPQKLQSLVKKSGPIIATSVKLRGEPFLNTIEQIQTKFPGLDFYARGKVSSQPSQIFRIFKDGHSKRLR